MKDNYLELDKIAREYHLNEDIPDKFIESICQEHCCRWLSNLLRTEDRVLELGYGDGITLSRLSSKVADYTVLEGAPSLIGRIRDGFPDVEVVHGLFEKYEPEEPYQKVLALHVLEHVDDPVSLLKYMKNWLAPNSELIIVVPNSESLHRRLAVSMGLQPKLDTLSERDYMVGHQRVYDLVSLRRDVLQAGYQILEEKGFFLKTLPNTMMLGHSPELIQALNDVADQLPPHLLANLGLRVSVCLENNEI